MFIPRARPKPMKRAYAIRQAPGFRKWIKKLGCSVKGCPNINIDPSHIRCGLPADALKGGTSLKPHDAWIIPLCRDHHNELGEDEPGFYVRHKIPANDLSQALWTEWLKTDSGKKYRLQHTEHNP